MDLGKRHVITDTETMGRWDIILSKMVTMMVVWARMVIMVLNMVMFMVVVVKHGS